MANKLKKAISLNIFLVKDKYTTRNQIIDIAKCKNTFDITVPGIGKSELFVNHGIPKPPKWWSSLFSDQIDLSTIGKNSNISAILLVKSSGRHYCLTFGQAARFLLKNDVFEERFGLLVALNSVSTDSLKCIDKQSLDSINSHTRIQAGFGTTADRFGLNVEQDMLKAIVGQPSDENIGTRMAGTDSLSVSVRMDLSDLKFLLDSYKQKFEQDLNATDYQWVNNITLLKNNTELVAKLNENLVKKFNDKNYQNLWLSIPEIVPWNYVKGFSFTHGKKTIYPDISINGFLSTLVGVPEITLDLLNTRKAMCLDGEHNYTFKSWPIYKCIYSEIDYEDEKYILNDGKWFKVNIDFVDRTNNEFSKIKKSGIALPEYKGGGEKAYNDTVAKDNPSTYANLDGDIVMHGGGHGKVEACDLFSKNKELLHVKIYGSSSSVLSHLFSQGFVSGQLIKLDEDFRRKVKDKLPPGYKKLIDIKTPPKDLEFTIIYAIISDTVGSDLHLPFFSRVNLNNFAKVLKGFGFKIELLKINCDEMYSKTKIIKPKKTKKNLNYLHS